VGQSKVLRHCWSFLLGFCLVCLNIQALSAQTSSSTQTQDLTNIQRMDQTGGQQTVIVPPSLPLRGFPIPGRRPLPPSLPIPFHYAKPTMDGNFGDVMDLAIYKDFFTYANAEALSEDHGKVEVSTSCLSSTPGRTTSPGLRILSAPKDQAAFKRRYELIGSGNYKSRDTKTISEQVLGIAIQEGLKIGADAMIVQQGAAMVQKSKGRVFGIFNPFSFVNTAVSATGIGNVAVGGVGFGRGQNAYVSKPWLQVKFYREIPEAYGRLRDQKNASRPQTTIDKKDSPASATLPPEAKAESPQPPKETLTGRRAGKATSAKKKSDQSQTRRKLRAKKPTKSKST
jgi:hypothetical protein